MWTLKKPTLPQVISTVKTVGKALLLTQAAAVVTVHAIDRMRKRRIPGGRHGFPTVSPTDSQIFDNTVRTYTEGLSLYSDMLAHIENATSHIYFETFIWRSDEWGQKFKDALISAARRGVDVYVVYDGFGVLNQNPFFYRMPKIPHLYVRRFPEIRLGMLLLDLRRTGRDHRKILVVDGKAAFVGGYNIGIPFAEEWRDTHVCITGPAVWELENGFVDFWNHFKLRHHPRLPDQGAREWHTEITAAFNLPSRLLYPVRGLYIDAIERATDRILITQAYFIPDREILNALCAAARRGVKIQVLIPEYSNHIMADWVARPYYGQLLRSGIEIWLYRHAMVHSKTMTVDGRWSTVGTANIDRLSLQGNYEVNMQFHSRELAQHMEFIFRNDLTTARKLTIEEWENRSWTTKALEYILHPFEFMV
ncbi:phospholipase D-like domain-containing protein [Schaalia sp. lx-260]|uniref:phospholipase D-like domain-containing protein n=1 Tax=Schaalia sp. lx-260 TaxID=2899082 RepID=UPI001E596FF4|nr:phospholipase D-like domain-containing protein [Schaalia sp. lx-260]MCD4550238.1 phospholipase D-like domain-containing protein [Schaalia sp. lx-260]